jgi:co-chaperonin GroES (HSP10)
MKVKAPSYHILVRLEKIDKQKEEYSSGGILIETHSNNDLKKEQEAIRLGTVLHIGPTAFHTKYTSDPWCKIGDVVQFHKYAGDLVQRPSDADGEVYRVIPDLDLKVVRCSDDDPEGVEI